MVATLGRDDDLGHVVEVHKTGVRILVFHGGPAVPEKAGAFHELGQLMRFLCVVAGNQRPTFAVHEHQFNHVARIVGAKGPTPFLDTVGLGCEGRRNGLSRAP